MPKITFLQRSNLSEDQWHSMLISLLRGLAALQVAAAHLRAEVYPAFDTVQNPTLAFQAVAFASGFAYLSVMVFFVLSGWLVGGSLLNRLDTERAMTNYAIDRVTRLWIVLVPTFGLVLLFGLAKSTLDPSRLSLAADNEFSVTAFFGNLAGLQNIFVPSFGGNFPLWSLANETWYYVLFPLLVMLFRSRSTPLRLGILVAIALIVNLVSSTILLYFSIWLLGVAFSRVRIECGALLRWVLLLALLATAVAIRLKGKNEVTVDTFPQFLAFSVIFVLLLASMQFKRASTGMLDRVGKFFSGFSFTLYVLHVPLMWAFLHFAAPVLGTGPLDPHQPAHLLVYVLLYAAIVVGAYLFHLPFEARTYQLREWLKKVLLARRARPGAELPAKSSAPQMEGEWRR